MSAKGYWIARVEVADEDGYQRYVAGANPAYGKYGGRLLVRGGPFEISEGPSRSRNVVIEFPSYQAAMDCYNSPEYQAAPEWRVKSAESELVVVEGYDGPQPSA